MNSTKKMYKMRSNEFQFTKNTFISFSQKSSKESIQKWMSSKSCSHENYIWRSAREMYLEMIRGYIFKLTLNGYSLKKLWSLKILSHITTPLDQSKGGKVKVMEFLLLARTFFKNLNSSVLEHKQRADLGFKTLSSMESFFNLLGFLEKKIPKDPPKFFRPYKKFKNLGYEPSSVLKACDRKMV